MEKTLKNINFNKLPPKVEKNQLWGELFIVIAKVLGKYSKQLIYNRNLKMLNFVSC